MGGIESTVRYPLAHSETWRQQGQLSQQIQGADLADARGSEKQGEAWTQFSVLCNHGQGLPTHLFHPAVQIAQRTFQILLHITRPGHGSRSSVQAIRLP